ncbi:MAG: DNA polymerase ligase N-terminal domain-containing protein [Thermoguttaceae bacterium]
MRYVILRHETAQGVHFDFMLEAEGALKTWSFAETPRQGVAVECHSLPDHRLAYLDYEGPISGGRGSVTCWDRGVYTVERRNEAEWNVTLAGDRLRGIATFIRSASDERRWRFLLS